MSCKCKLQLRLISYSICIILLLFVFMSYWQSENDMWKEPPFIATTININGTTTTKTTINKSNTTSNTPIIATAAPKTNKNNNRNKNNQTTIPNISKFDFDASKFPYDISRLYTFNHEKYCKQFHQLPQNIYYQQSLKLNKFQFISVSGLYDTGTNALFSSLRRNFEQHLGFRRVRWAPQKFSKHSFNPSMSSLDSKLVTHKELIVVLIRDPLTLFQSICKQSYSLRFQYFNDWKQPGYKYNFTNTSYYNWSCPGHLWQFSNTASLMMFHGQVFSNIMAFFNAWYSSWMYDPFTLGLDRPWQFDKSIPRKGRMNVLWADALTHLKDRKLHLKYQKEHKYNFYFPDNESAENSSNSPQNYNYSLLNSSDFELKLNSGNVNENENIAGIGERFYEYHNPNPKRGMPHNRRNMHLYNDRVRFFVESEELTHFNYTPYQFTLDRKHRNFSVHNLEVNDEARKQFVTNPEIPHIIVRFEDLLFQPYKLIEFLSQCIGSKYDRDNVYLIEEQSKEAQHSTTNRTGAIAKYGHPQFRFQVYDERDLTLLKQELNQTILDVFGYQF